VCWGKRGDQEEQALGRSKGGFTTKIHVASDALGNPIKLVLSGGNRHDVTQADELLEGLETERVIADKGYDSDEVVSSIQAKGAEAVIPPRTNRIEARQYDRELTA
jgi:transposase